MCEETSDNNEMGPWSVVGEVAREFVGTCGQPRGWIAFVYGIAAVMFVASAMFGAPWPAYPAVVALATAVMLAARKTRNDC